MKTLYYAEILHRRVSVRKLKTQIVPSYVKLV